MDINIPCKQYRRSTASTVSAGSVVSTGFPHQEALACLATTVALVAIGVWVNNVGYGDAFLAPGETEDTFSLVRCVYHMGRVLAPLSFILFPLAVERAEPALKACVPMLLSCMTAAFLLSYHQSLVPPQVIGCIAAAVMGAGYYLVVACLYLGLASAVDLKAALVVVGVSQILEQLFSIALSSFCPRTWQVVVCIALPLAVMAAYPAIGRTGGTGTEGGGADGVAAERPESGGARSGGTGARMQAARAHATRGQLEGTPTTAGGVTAGMLTPVMRYQLILLVVANVSVLATAMLSDVGTWGYIRNDYRSGNSFVPMAQTLFAGAIVLVATYVFLIRAIDKPITYRYQGGFLFLAAIIMASVTARAFGTVSRDAVAALLFAGEYFSHVLMWSIVIETCGSTSLPRYRIVGIGTGVFASLSLVVVALDWAGVSFLEIPAIMAAYCVVLAVTMYPGRLLEAAPARVGIRDGIGAGVGVENGDGIGGRIGGGPHAQSSGGLGIGSEDAPDGDVRDLIAAVGNRCDRLAEQYDLSRRETEVLSLIVQGRSRPSIQSMLVLSEGTVKTHIAHIFRKTGVSSTQELLDLVYDTSV